jgi:hypothetical protein
MGAVIPMPRIVVLALFPLMPLVAARPGSVAAQPALAGGFEDGVPFWVWQALPQAFPEYVPGPGGYLSFGFDWNLGERLPVGLEMTAGRIPMIRSESGPAGVNGARPELEAYRRFLASAARDPRFTADTLMPLIRYHVRLSWLDRLRYRHLVIPRARETLARLGEG